MESTVKSLANQYDAFSNDEKGAFLQLVGAKSTAEAAFMLAHGLPVTEQGRFAEMVALTLFDLGFFEQVQKEAIQVVREHPGESIDELEQRLDKHLREFLPVYNAGIVKLAEAERKKKQYPANKVKARQDAIRKLLEVNPDLTPGQLRKILMEQQSELASTKRQPIKLKTIQNDLSAIKKRQR